MDPFRLIAERKIQEAMEDGAFENLAGAGQPLVLEENPWEDPAQRMGHRLLRNNGFAPRWIEEGKDIESAAARLRADQTAGRISAVEFCRRAAELNRRILSYNLQVPFAAMHKRPIELTGS